jgi:hypothetical protein
MRNPGARALYRQARPAWTALAILALTVHAGASMKMTPYVQAVTTNSIYVTVECSSTSVATVQYGATNGYGSVATTESYLATTASPVTCVHRIKLTGLSPNTQYHYRATHDGVTWSLDSTFYTAVPPGTPFRFASYADTRTQTSIHNTIAGLAKAANPRFTLLCGDVCGDTTYNTYKNEWFVANELALQAVAPTYNAPGNHETWGTNTKAFFQSPASTSGTQAYYSFDYGDAHIVSVNNQVDYSVGGTQYNWVQGDLGSTQPWKIVFFHYSAYVAGGHGEEPTMIQWSNNLFAPKNVDLVLTGHSHFYQHNLVNGINHYVLGTAGAPFATLGSAPYVIKSALEYHYAIIDVTPTTLHMEVITNNGTLLDQLDLVKTVAAARTKTDNTIVDIIGPSIVTHVPTEPKVFYIQDSSGLAGIRVETDGARPVVGAKVLVRGTLGTTTGGERVLRNAIVTDKTTGETIDRGMNNRSVGGSSYVGEGGAGQSNQGLMVRVWGKVTKAITDPVLGRVFWLNDGSGVDGGELDGTKGLKVIESGLSPSVGSYLKLAGVVGSEKKGSQLIRVIRYHESLP